MTRSAPDAEPSTLPQPQPSRKTVFTPKHPVTPVPQCLPAGTFLADIQGAQALQRRRAPRTARSALGTEPPSRPRPAPRAPPREWRAPCTPPAHPAHSFPSACHTSGFKSLGCHRGGARKGATGPRAAKGGLTFPGPRTGVRPLGRGQRRGQAPGPRGLRRPAALRAGPERRSAARGRGPRGAAGRPHGAASRHRDAAGSFVPAPGGGRDGSRGPGAAARTHLPLQLHRSLEYCAPAPPSTTASSISSCGGGRGPGTGSRGHRRPARPSAARAAPRMPLLRRGRRPRVHARRTDPRPGVAGRPGSTSVGSRREPPVLPARPPAHPGPSQGRSNRWSRRRPRL